jgi:hypothetical protein
METMSSEERRKVLKDGGTPLPREEDNGHASNGKPKRNRGNKHAKGRFVILNAFVDNQKRKMSTTAIAAWMVLYRHGQADGTVRIGIELIADRIGTSESTAKRAVKELREAGFVKVLEAGNSFKKQTNKYQLHGDPLI